MQISDKITVLDYSIVAIYLVIVLGIGMVVSYRRRHSEDLFLSGRSLGWFPVGMSIFGTNVSPTFLIATFGLAYQIGMVGANFEWMAWIFLFLLAMLFMPHYLTTNVSTMPEFLERRYNSKCRTFLSWYALLTTIWVWVGATLFVGGIILSQIMDWSVLSSVVLLCIVATFITVAGGLAAVAFTDSFQCILLVGASAWMTILGLIKVGGISKLVESVPSHFWVLFKPASDSEWPWYAIVLGYPVAAIWFWCTDQTIVQRVLGARDTKQGQLGCVLASFLKILTPLIFYAPGVICRVLNPGIQDTNEAYLTMVVKNMPVGAIGLVIAIMMSAVIAGTSAGLNSFSTVFTLDVYNRYIRPDASRRENKIVGQIAALLAAALAIVIAMGFKYASKYMDLFQLTNSLIGFFSPPMAAVFLIGVLWRRATPTAGFLTLSVGCVVSVATGILYLFVFPKAVWWPHFLMISFYLFLGLCIFEIVVSLFTKPLPPDQGLVPVTFAYFKSTGEKRVWLAWGVLLIIMTGIYLLFNHVFW